MSKTIKISIFAAAFLTLCNTLAYSETTRRGQSEVTIISETKRIVKCLPDHCDQLCYKINDNGTVTVYQSTGPATHTPDRITETGTFDSSNCPTSTDAGVVLEWDAE